jgi:LysM repeat protein
MKKRFTLALCSAVLLLLLTTLAAFADDTVTYVVKPGDTLSKIAHAHNTTVNAIARANGISNRINHIFAGELLVIPTRHPHVLIDRPTASEIARGSVRVTGRSDTFEAHVALRVLDRNLRVVGSGFAMGGSLGEYRRFEGVVTFSVPFAQVGYVEAYEVSAKDGSMIHTESVRVLLTPAGGGSVTRYTVRVGDTLSGIARRFGVTVAALARANQLTNINRIYAGQVLIIPR